LPFKLDGRIAAVAEIGVVGVLTRQLVRQPPSLLARRSQLLLESVTRLGTQLGRFRHRSSTLSTLNGARITR